MVMIDVMVAFSGGQDFPNQKTLDWFLFGRRGYDFGQKINLSVKHLQIFQVGRPTCRERCLWRLSDPNRHGFLGATTQKRWILFANSEKWSFVGMDHGNAGRNTSNHMHLMHIYARGRGWNHALVGIPVLQFFCCRTSVFSQPRNGEVGTAVKS